MQYQPVTAVWEITFACNMRCKHCGSGCNTRKPDELTTREALTICDQIGQLGLKYITLSGGEPLLRKDWHQIAGRLKKNGVITNMITNGWFLGRKQVQQAKESGISNIAISLDGMQETHDLIRQKGSFERIFTALDTLRENNLPASAITTVSQKNLHELPAIYGFLKEKNVRSWQLQYAMPMGNFMENEEWIIGPSQIDEIIEQARTFSQERKVVIDLADCVGYYNQYELEVRAQRGGDPEDYFWTGCPAGKNVLGIRYNGDVVGCTSLRDDGFIEDNVRNRSLVDIWNDPESFEWNRNLTKKELTGFCARCQYGSYCLAGCSVLKFTTGKKLRENQYCSYKVACDRDNEEIRQIEDTKRLMEMGSKAIEEEAYQFAEACLHKVYLQDEKDIDVLDQLGFVNYKLENFETSLDYNQKVLAMDPDNAYALKGQGLCLVGMGEYEAGVQSLVWSIEKAPVDYLDPYYDLSLVYYQHKQYGKALEIFEKACRKSGDFKRKYGDLYPLIQHKTKEEKVTDQHVLTTQEKL